MLKIITKKQQEDIEKIKEMINLLTGEAKKDYEQPLENLLKENENLKQENKKLQESHDYIFDAYQDAGKKMFDYQEENNELKQALLTNKNLYEEVCNKNKELEEENKQLKKNYMNPTKTRISYYDKGKGIEVVIEGFIPKSLIKEKIEELNKLKARNKKRDFDTVYKDGYFTGGIDTLQEILGEEK